jgi:hypothetical protein
VLRTLEERFDLPMLTRRDANASSLGDILSLESPRTDTPSTVTPATIDQAAESGGAGSDAPLTEFQRSLLALAEILPAVETPELQAKRQAARPRDSEQTAQVYIEDKVRRILTPRE